MHVQIPRETLYLHKINPPPVSDRPSDLSGGAYFFHISCNSNPGRMSVYCVPSLISNCLQHFSSVVALLIRVTLMQIRCARDSPRSRKACIVQIQTAQCRAIGVCKRVRNSEAEGFGRAKQGLWASDSKLTERAEDLEKEAKFHLTSLPRLQGGMRGLGDNNRDPNRK